MCIVQEMLIQEKQGEGGYEMGARRGELKKKL